VAPGAPVLTSLSILDPSTGAHSDVDKTTTDCAAGVMEAGTCDAMNDGACRLTVASSSLTTICRCDPDPTGMTTGAWTCSYGPLSIVVATFDRLPDAAPLDPGDGGAPGVTGVAKLLSAPPPPNASVTLGTLATFDSTGSPTGLVFNVFFGINGPRITLMGQPATPAGATVTFQLDGTKVRARDGQTPFTWAGPLLQDGVISFATVPFSLAGITVPTAPAAADGTPAPMGTPAPVDGGPVTVSFNNIVDTATILDHIQLTDVGTGAPFTGVTADTSGGSSVTFTPNMACASNPQATCWPAGGTFMVSVDVGASDAVGDTLPAGAPPQPVTFTTEAN
jgi:hypothetical protein